MLGVTHFSSERRSGFTTDSLWSLCCSCPFLNPDLSGIHRALEIASIGDKSPNYKTLSVQLRKFFYNV